MGKSKNVKKRESESWDEWSKRGGKIDFSDRTLADVWDMLCNEVPVNSYGSLGDQIFEELENRISSISKRTYEQ